MPIKQGDRWLKRTFQPYAGQTIILGAVSVFVIWLRLNRDANNIIFVVPVLLTLFGFTIFFGLRYRVGWNDKEIFQEASGTRRINLPFEDIERLEIERSTAGELLAAARPFRRLVIYGQSSSEEPKRIDVSLKHFALSDIEALIAEVRRRRPELKVGGLSLRQ